MTLVLMLLFLFAASFTLKKTVLLVPHGYAWTIERFGKYSRTAGPGLLYLIPVVQRVGKKINMMKQVLELPSQDIPTKDGVLVKVNGVAFFEVLDAAKAAYGVPNLEQSMLTLVLANVRIVIASMGLNEAMCSRDEINNRLVALADPVIGPWGIKIIRIELKDIQPPPDVVDAMAREMQAERERLRASKK